MPASPRQPGAASSPGTGAAGRRSRSRSRGALAVLFLVAFLAFSASPASPLFAAQAARIDRIVPAAGRPGDRVTIEGIGFGGLNVRVRVGGVRAALVSATGGRATFLVPPGIAQGPTQVTATNPGGHTGAIAFGIIEGILLPGNPSAPAESATLDLPEVPVDPGQIEDGVIMTRLDVRFALQATVGQVNSALGLVGGGIVSMTRGQPFVTISVPRPPTVAALRKIARDLSAEPGVLWAFAGGESAPQMLPFAASAFPNRNLLPTRFPAAWNAMHLAVDGCEARKVPILVADNFIRPNPYAEFPVQIPDFFPSPPTEPGSPKAPTHGYDVVTTMAALFDGRNPTGANPFSQCLSITGVQVAGLLPSQEISRLVRSFPVGQRFILNYSRAFRGECVVGTVFAGSKNIEHCDDTSVDDIASAYERAGWAEEWKKLTFSEWDRFLVTPAAGNFRADPTQTASPEGFASSVYPGLGIARFASAFNIVTDADPFFGFAGNPGLWRPAVPDPDLTADPIDVSQLRAAVVSDGLDRVGRADNVLITGSTTQSDALQALIESAFSNVGPDVTAVGERITTLGSPESGTSFSAPQVAGLASYLWLLSGDLRNNQPSSVTRRAIVDNTNTLPLAGSVIDAYASALSLDAAALPDPSNAPVRLAILDLNNDGTFDEADISSFLGVYLDSNGVPLEPASPDYDRFDLNGDGFSGGSHTDRFDLDRVGSTQYGQTQYTGVTQSIEGQNVSFDENDVKDLEILCYYAYSGLYTGDPAARTGQLASLCGVTSPISVSFAFAGAQVQPGGQSCRTCAVKGFLDSVLDLDSPGRNVTANYPTTTVTDSDPASGGGFTVSGAASAAGSISRGPGGSLTLSGTGSADGSAQVRGDAQANSASIASTEFTFVLPTTCAFTVTVTLNHIGSDTDARFSMTGGGVGFETVGGSKTGVLPPGQYSLDATVNEFASASLTAPSDTEHAEFSFTLTLTPK